MLCAVTIPPADLRSLSLYYYAVCSRMCMSSVMLYYSVISVSAKAICKCQLYFETGEKGTRFIFENAVRLVAKLQTTIVQAN